MTLGPILLATFAGGVASVLLAATVSLAWLPHVAQRALPFATGALLTVAVTGALPEAIALGLDGGSLGATLLAGFLLFFLLEQLVGWLHAPRGPAVDRRSARVALVVAGDGLHNFVDGVLIAAAFATDPALGWSAAIGVLAHELPQELADFVVLLDAGLTRGRALALNAASGVATVAGGIAGYLLLDTLRELVPVVLALAAASFLYVALAGLVPALHERNSGREAPLQLALLVAGILAVTLVSRFA